MNIDDLTVTVKGESTLTMDDINKLAVTLQTDRTDYDSAIQKACAEMNIEFNPATQTMIVPFSHAELCGMSDKIKVSQYLEGDTAYVMDDPKDLDPFFVRGLNSS